MNRREKALIRLASKPKDFEWKELEALMKSLGFRKIEGAGSRVKFCLQSDPSLRIAMHTIHGRSPKTLPPYQISNLLEFLSENGFYEEELE